MLHKYIFTLPFIVNVTLIFFLPSLHCSTILYLSLLVYYSLKFIFELCYFYLAFVQQYLFNTFYFNVPIEIIYASNNLM